MFKVLTRCATIPLVTVRLLLSPPACGTVEGLAGQRHVQAASSSLSSLKRHAAKDGALCQKLRRHHSDNRSLLFSSCDPVISTVLLCSVLDLFRPYVTYIMLV